jgi:hypothetical protein
MKRGPGEALYLVRFVLLRSVPKELAEFDLPN